MARAAVLIVHSGSIALIERHTPQRGTYYLFPGGGIEAGETSEAAAAREAWEELGVSVTVGPCVAEVTRNGNMQYHYLAEIVEGSFGTGTGAEIVGENAPDAGTYTPVWLSLDKLVTQPVFPRQVAALVVEAVTSEAWPPLQRFNDDG